MELAGSKNQPQQGFGKEVEHYTVCSFAAGSINTVVDETRKALITIRFAAAAATSIFCVRFYFNPIAQTDRQIGLDVPRWTRGKGTAQNG